MKKAGLAVLVAVLAAAQAPAFEQDRFAIGFWVDPPMDEQAEMRYQRIADAHFNMVIGGFGANTPEKVRRQVELCEKHGMKAIIDTCDWSVEALPRSTGVWGYRLRDEPSADEFPELAARVKAIRESHPDKLAYINLFPSVCDTARLGAKSYREHVQRFADEVKPDVISFDHYPTMKPGEDGRPRYCYSLEVVREVALEKGVPFWNFFNTMPYGHHSDPTEGQLRWQIFTSIAYGAKGVMYFCYYTPLSHEFPKGGAIIGRDDVPTRHYGQAARINADLKNLGPALMQLTSTQVAHVRPGQTPAEELAGTPVTDLQRAAHDPEHDFIVGAFSHADGRRAVLLVNNRYGYSAWPTVVFDAAADGVREVCKKTGAEIAVRDDSPDMDGLQVSFDAGDARLFLMP